MPKRILITSIICCLLAACSSYHYDKTSGLYNPSSPQKTITPLFQSNNLWQVMAKDFNLPDESSSQNTDVKEQIAFYSRNARYLNHIAEQAQPYLYYIYQQVKLRHLPAELALLPMLESNYDPFASSKVGAAGLWQLMPGTGSGFGVKVDWWYDGRRDIIASTNAALNYLQYLGEFFNHHWLLAIAAYDTGEGNVNNAIQKNMKAGKSSSFWALDLPQETQNYVPKLLAIAAIIKNPAKYHISLPPVKNEPYLTAVTVNSQIALSRAAEMADISLAQLSHLNPGFYRWATDPDIPARLLLPIDKAAIFERHLKEIDPKQLITWIRYQTKPGDSLISIAKKYKTNAHILKTTNRLKSNTISLNQNLLIPTSTSTLTKIVLHKEQRYLVSPNVAAPKVVFDHYVIQKGDTINSIAKKYRVKTREVQFWNSIKKEADITPGKQLIIWPHERHIIKNPYTPTVIYTVKHGDTLGSIADQFNTTIKTLKHINGLPRASIYFGEKLYVPSKKGTLHVTRFYTVRKGDTLSIIAEKHHVKTKELMQWNHMKDPSALKPNQQLAIY